MSTLDSMSATHCPRKFKKLDFALGTAITAIASGDLGRELILEAERLANTKKLISGRQMLWMVYRYMHDKDQCADLNDYEDLMTVVLKHESNLRPFRRNWDNILMGCHKRPEDPFLETLFLRNIKTCTCLKYDLDRYYFSKSEKGEDGLPTPAAIAFKGYQFLYNSVDNYLNRTLGETQRASHLQALQGTKPDLAPIYIDKGKKGGKGKVKNKCNGKGTTNLKAIPCKYYPAGTCYQGDKCLYGHGQGGAQDNTEGSQPVVKPTAGSTICWHHSNGGCKFGDSCKKSHAAPLAPISKRKARKLAAIEHAAAEEKKAAKKAKKKENKAAKKEAEE